MTSSIYTVGGTVQAGGGRYIARAADEQLFGLCRDAVFAYVLAPRQVGKSSLMVRTAERLSRAGIRSALIDLTQLGVQLSAEEWYLGLITTIEDQLVLTTDTVAWWQARAHLGFTQRLTQFFQEVLLAEISTPIVVFVDEIDTTLSLNFTDDFYAAIRYLYNARSRVPQFARLSFVLVGVATPGDLIRDPQRTPFNIGQRVDLTDWSLQEALPLAEGLGLPASEARRVLGRMLQWTGGHPYLTQRLCHAMTANRARGWASEEIDRVVRNTFFGAHSEQDNNLQFVRDMLTKRAPNPIAVLATYREIRRGQRAVPDEEQSLVKSHLLLSGAVRRANGTLQVRNAIYWYVFSERWVREHLPSNYWAKRLQRTARLAGLLLVATISLGLLALYFYSLRLQAEAATALADARLHQAEANQALAESRRVEAVTAQAQAESRRQEAVAAQATAEARRQEAEQAKVQADARSYVIAARSASDPKRALSMAIQAGELVQQKRVADIDGQIEAVLYQTIQSLRTRAVLRGHRSIVYSAVYSPDGSRIVTASRDGTAWIWNASTGESIVRLNGHSGGVVSVAWSPDGKRVVTASSDKTARIWDAATGASLTVLKGHTENLLSTKFSPDGKQVVTASSDSTARVWNAASGAQVFVLSGHTSAVDSVAWSPDGKQIATASSDGTAKIWNAANGQEMASLQAHTGTVLLVRFDPTSRRIVTASSDGTARIWDARTGASVAELAGHSDSVLNAEFSPNGQQVVTGSDDYTARVWDAATGALVTELAGHSGSVVAAHFSPDGKQVVTASRDGTARVWNAGTGALVAELAGHSGSLRSAHFSPDGRQVLTAGDDKTARVWDVKIGLVATELPGSISRASFSPSGRYVASIGDDGSARVWDVARVTVVRRLSIENALVTGAAFSPDERQVVTAGNDGSAWIWDITSDTPIAKLEGYGSPLLSATFSSDGRQVLTLSEDTTARVWDARTGQESELLRSYTYEALGTSWNPKSQQVLTINRDPNTKYYSVWLWSPEKPSSPLLLRGDAQAIKSATYSLDGKHLVTAGEDAKARVWDTATGAVTAELSGHLLAIDSAAFSRDGLQVVTASEDGTARVWNAATGEQIAPAMGHAQPVVSAAFSPDGRQVLTVAADNTARIWDAASGTLIAVVGTYSSLTTAEWSPDGAGVLIAGDGAAQISIANFDKLLDLARTLQAQ